MSKSNDHNASMAARLSLERFEDTQNHHVHAGSNISEGQGYVGLPHTGSFQPIGRSLKEMNMDNVISTPGLSIGPASMKEGVLNKSITEIGANLEPAILSKESAITDIIGNGNISLNNVSPTEQMNAGAALSAIHNPGKAAGNEH